VTDAECNAALSSEVMAGVCGGASPQQGDCATLAQCCAALPAAAIPTECTQVANNGTFEACQTSLEAYMSAGYCGTDAGQPNVEMCGGGMTAIAVTVYLQSLSTVCDATVAGAITSASAPVVTFAPQDSGKFCAYVATLASGGQYAIRVTTPGHATVEKTVNIGTGCWARLHVA
jgi:hypothetical protein